MNFNFLFEIVTLTLLSEIVNFNRSLKLMNFISSAEIVMFVPRSNIVNLHLSPKIMNVIPLSETRDLSFESMRNY